MKNIIFKKIMISILISSMFLNQGFITFAAPPAKKEELKIKNKYTGKITSINENKMIITLADLNKEKIKEFRKKGPAAKKNNKEVVDNDFSLDVLFNIKNEKITIDISKAKFGKPLDIEIKKEDEKKKPNPPDKNEQKETKPTPPDKKADKKGKFDYTDYNIGDFVEVRLEKNSYKAKNVNAVKIPSIKEIIKRYEKIKENKPDDKEKPKKPDEKVEDKKPPKHDEKKDPKKTDEKIEDKKEPPKPDDKDKPKKPDEKIGDKEKEIGKKP